MFEYRFIKFEYLGSTFQPIRFTSEMPFDQLRELYTAKPMTVAERELQRIRFGECLVKVPKKTVVQILLDEVLDPFYIF